MNPAAFGVKREPLGIFAELGGARITGLAPRTPLYTAGSPGKELYFLEFGLVTLHASMREREDFVYEVVVPGSLFGDECLTGSGVYASNASAVTAGGVWSIPAERAREEFERHSPGSQWILDVLAQRRSRQNRRMRAICIRSVPHRILETILDLSAWFPGAGGLEADLPVSQAMMARMVCSTRETVSAQLNRFAATGLLRLSLRHIGVPSLERVVEALRRLEYR